MATIKSFRDTPPGGWRYVQPETGVHFDGDNFDDLLAKIRPHREYKGIPCDNLSLDVQRQLCVRLSLSDCEPEPGEDYRPVQDLTGSLTVSMALSLGRAVSSALLEVASGGSALCSPEESQRRAAICRGCPLNKPAGLCSCSAVYVAVEKAIPKSRRLEGISVCMACGCSLQAKANLPASVVAASTAPGTVFPPWCWQPGAPL